MATTLTSISDDLKLSIYEQLEDLDDAWNLSQTCKEFQEQMRTIQKQVIVSSPVYEYDLHLPRILKYDAASAQLYRDLGKVLPDEYRPEAKEGIECITTEVDMKALKDAEIREIIIRWRKFTFLRELYMDEDLFKDFEDFRFCSLNPPNLSENSGVPLMEPDRARGGIKRTHAKYNRLFGSGFKGLFHKSIVLHSTAIGCLQFLRRAVDLPTDATLRDSDAPDLEDIVIKLTVKQATNFSGQFVLLPLADKIDCLEVFDFLYVFLLPKILPFELLASWIGNDAGEWPYTGDVAYHEFEIEAWHAFMDLSRWVFQPHDLVELIENRAWNGTYPADKSMYMQTRGMFERVFEREKSIYDSRVFCDREHMVKDLRSTPGFILKDAEDPCWWDRIRVHCGSTFIAESLSRYEEDLEKLKQAEGQKFGEDSKAA